jgi:nicotinamidase-related amidase
LKEIYGNQVRETIEEVLDPRIAAVVAVDLQNDAMHPMGICAKAGMDVSAMLAIRPLCANFIDAARSLDVPVFHVRLVDLPNGRSTSPAWLRSKVMIGATDRGGYDGPPECMVDGTWGAEFAAGCSPLPNEVVVTKHRSSAFVGTQLDMLLRAARIESVVVMGEQTPGCVEATIRDAAHRDYYTVLVEDCVAAFNHRLHDAAMTVLRSRHDVCTSEQITQIWESHTEQGRKASTL